MTLGDQIEDLLDLMPIPEDRRARYRARLAEGALTRDEGRDSHFCAYFLPVNPQTGQVYMVHHRKAGKWLSPGGHIDAGELLEETVVREVREELGLTVAGQRLKRPFHMTITPIDISKEKRNCAEHFEVWFLIPTDGSEFDVDMEEFYDTRWMSIDEAIELTEDDANREALTALKYRMRFGK